MKHDFTPIDSGHMDGARYDSSARKLHIRFKNGYQYIVHDVTQQDFQDFMNADSRGEHYHQVLKHSFKIERSK